MQEAKSKMSTTRRDELLDLLERHIITPAEFERLTNVNQAQVEEEEEEEETTPTKIGCRVFKECFTNGQRIRHKIGINKGTWIAVYDSSDNVVVCDGMSYKTISRFAKEHYRKDRRDRVSSANGWKECECEVNGKWISTYNLESNG